MESELAKLIPLLRSSRNPEQVVMGLLENQFPNNPMTRNIITLVRQGKYSDVEKIARNLAAQRGLDFDKEFQAFKQMFGF